MSERAKSAIRLCTHVPAGHLERSLSTSFWGLVAAFWKRKKVWSCPIESEAFQNPKTWPMSFEITEICLDSPAGSPPIWMSNGSALRHLCKTGLCSVILLRLRCSRWRSPPQRQTITRSHAIRLRMLPYGTHPSRLHFRHRCRLSIFHFCYN